jgi:hypothetical protein
MKLSGLQKQKKNIPEKYQGMYAYIYTYMHTSYIVKPKYLELKYLGSLPTLKLTRCVCEKITQNIPQTFFFLKINRSFPFVDSFETSWLVAHHTRLRRPGFEKGIVGFEN